MDRGWIIKFVLILGVCAAAAYLLYPSYYFYYQASDEQRQDHEAFCAALPPYMPCKKVNLGLDLQGGVHLVMGVKVEKAIEHRLDSLIDSVRESLKKKEFAFTRIERPRDALHIELELPAGTDVNAVEKYLRREYSILDVVSTSDNVITLEVEKKTAQQIKTDTVEQAIKTIRNRADQFGVTEPTIAKRGDTNVLIQLPGIKDPERAIQNIGRTAQLEFKIVDEAASAVLDEVDVASLPQGVTKRERDITGPKGETIREVFFELAFGDMDLTAQKKMKESLRALAEPKLPSNRQLAFGAVRLPDTQKNKPNTMQTYVLEARAGLTGDYLTDAYHVQDRETGTAWYVIMDFDLEGAKRFADLTEKNVKRSMAIVLDNTVNSAPNIREKIAGGTARIELGRGGNQAEKFQEARDLSLVLKAGALPAPVEVREQREVGKTLGEESVAQGTLAIAVGALLVVLFMLIYYKASGVVANVALTLNVVLVLAVMAALEATLTLPGMAGIVLTIGMAVDANVIIFERIREELRVGKNPQGGDRGGLLKAFSTILDANVTTLIAGIVLYEYGSGPVRGFAVTLIIGILCSMFTAIVVTRSIYDFFSSRRRLQTLSI
ncbi:MAG: protein translocase subunit SecD [Myxococcota bacterium]